MLNALNRKLKLFTGLEMVPLNIEVWWFLLLCLGRFDCLEINHNGYILFCPCMGRFGNQVETYLGTVGFAKKLNRSLVLPPWVEYRKGEPHSVQIPFNSYFDVEPLKDYLDVITMEDFMRFLAPDVWPVGKRTVFCYMERSETKGCDAKHGNPFGPFWDTFNISFDSSEFFQPLYYSSSAEEWNRKYSASKYPVLAFVASPATFPMQKEHVHLQKYLRWNKNITDSAEHFIKTVLPKGPFVGMHLRNGPDWDRACEHIRHGVGNLFSSPQCLGYNNEHGSLTFEMCLPSANTIVKQVKRIVQQSKAKSVFVASDNNHMIDELSEALSKLQCSVHKLKESNPHLELAILGKANQFIGNCVSSFSGFAVRERNVMGFASNFWAFPQRPSRTVRTEL